jgi:hypothetical protein
VREHSTVMKSANAFLEFLRRISRRRRSAQQGVESIAAFSAKYPKQKSPAVLEEWMSNNSKSRTPSVQKLVRAKPRPFILSFLKLCNSLSVNGLG